MGKGEDQPDDSFSFDESSCASVKLEVVMNTIPFSPSISPSDESTVA